MRYGVGVDVSKGKSTVAIVDENGKLVKRIINVNHLQSELKEFEKIINNLGKENIKIVMEQTGNYYLPIYSYLLDKEYVVVAENAFKIKKYLDREIRKSKTDKKDAIKLANYAIENWNKLESKIEEKEEYKNLRFLSRQYFTQTSIKAKQKVDLSNLCDQLFPGFYEFLNTDNFEIGIEILKKYYHPTLVKKEKEEEFILNVEKIAEIKGHTRAARTLAYKIYALAQESVPVYPCNEFAKLAVRQAVNLLIASIKSTQIIISEMEKIASTLIEYDEIIKIPGVGKKLAVRIIAEIGDIKKFKNAGSLIAYAGLDSPAYQSGKLDVSSRHISKRGNKYLRKTGYEIMKCIKSSCKGKSEIYDYIVKKEQEGKLKKVAKIAGLNKFLRIYYGIIKRIYKDENQEKQCA